MGADADTRTNVAATVGVRNDIFGPPYSGHSLDHDDTTNDIDDRTDADAITDAASVGADTVASTNADIYIYIYI